MFLHSKGNINKIKKKKPTIAVRKMAVTDLLRAGFSQTLDLKEMQHP